ncbi:helix-turn-helix domain-containing protein [Haloimpatiens sp. FM7315]|uniref:helix-turn-helix domain-containing protein n=1 Tax=Haloimpatiens sp. FM7315 TaxID=3298609 RepID=UPI0035A3C93F
MKLSNIEILADMLISAREEKGYSQRQLALKTGVSNSEISKLEKGQRLNPNLKILKKLSDALGLNYEEMLEALGYIKSEYSFEDNTGCLDESEQEYIINTLTNAWQNDIDTKIDFSNKDSLREILFGNNIKNCDDDFSIEKNMPMIAKLIKENKDILYKNNNTKKLYELISWYVSFVRGEN